MITQLLRKAFVMLTDLQTDRIKNLTSFLSQYGFILQTPEKDYVLKWIKNSPHCELVISLDEEDDGTDQLYWTIKGGAKGQRIRRGDLLKYFSEEKILSEFIRNPQVCSRNDFVIASLKAFQLFCEKHLTPFFSSADWPDIPLDWGIYK